MDDSNKIDTGGGPLIGGDVNSHGDFVGRDVNNSTTLSRDLTINGSLVVAIVAVLFIGIIGIIAIIKRNEKETTGIPIATPTQLSNPGRAPSSSTLSVNGEQDCIANYLSEVRKNEWRVVEVGARAQPLTFSTKSQSAMGLIGPLGVIVTENGQPLAAIKFNLLSSSSVFKITSVVDAQCQAIEDYSNTQIGSRNDILQNFDALKIQVAKGVYIVRFEWLGGDRIEFDVLLAE